ncbi:unnamed protein product [Notodromas monacha]|uniref:Uncharacterized protein n=1 Tax=Notodromas monacha TaxID=399045 RepID=A0A7R9BK28_9CRUS|nr:unnamed protein product [Notodromas monacha]CAG0915834.1 unnamed protein product [Notodromas monacha]
MGTKGKFVEVSKRSSDVGHSENILSLLPHLQRASKKFPTSSRIGRKEDVPNTDRRTTGDDAEQRLLQHPDLTKGNERWGDTYPPFDPEIEKIRLPNEVKIDAYNAPTSYASPSSYGPPPPTRIRNTNYGPPPAPPRPYHHGPTSSSAGIHYRPPPAPLSPPRPIDDHYHEHQHCHFHKHVSAKHHPLWHHMWKMWKLGKEHGRVTAHHLAKAFKSKLLHHPHLITPPVVHHHVHKHEHEHLHHHPPRGVPSVTVDVVPAYPVKHRDPVLDYDGWIPSSGDPFITSPGSIGYYAPPRRDSVFDYGFNLLDMVRQRKRNPYATRYRYYGQPEIWPGQPGIVHHSVTHRRRVEETPHRRILKTPTGQAIHTESLIEHHQPGYKLHESSTNNVQTGGFDFVQVRSAEGAELRNDTTISSSTAIAATNTPSTEDFNATSNPSEHSRGSSSQQQGKRVSFATRTKTEPVPAVQPIIVPPIAEVVFTNNADDPGRRDVEEVTAKSEVVQHQTNNVFFPELQASAGGRITSNIPKKLVMIASSDGSK